MPGQMHHIYMNLTNSTHKYMHTHLHVALQKCLHFLFSTESQIAGKLQLIPIAGIPSSQELSKHIPFACMFLKQIKSLSVVSEGHCATDLCFDAVSFSKLVVRSRPKAGILLSSRTAVLKAVLVLPNALPVPYWSLTCCNTFSANFPNVQSPRPWLPPHTSSILSAIFVGGSTQCFHSSTRLFPRTQSGAARAQPAHPVCAVSMVWKARPCVPHTRASSIPGLFIFSPNRHLGARNVTGN